MENQDLSVADSRERLEGHLHIIQMETTRERLTGVATREIKQEPEEKLEQCWEIQRWDRSKREPSPQTQSSWSHSEEAMNSLKLSFKGLSDAPQWPYEDRKSSEVDRSQGLSGNGVGKVIVEEEDTVSLELRRRRFRQFCYWEEEGPRDVFSQLWELGHQWLKPQRHTKEQILELLILEQFLTILPEEMQSWVSEREPESCSQAVVLAEDFLLALKEAESHKKQVRNSSVLLVATGSENRRQSWL